MYYLHETSTADEFLMCVRQPSSTLHSDSHYRFRGEGDADWRLVPSARRRNAWEAMGGLEAWGLTSEKEYVTSPLSDVKRALKDVERYLEQVIERLGYPPALREPDTQRAFAQHVGLPTLLLDWTRNPDCAAYFAAESALLRAPEGRLAVYVMPQLFTGGREGEGIRWVRVNAHGNDNLVAQDGLLLEVATEEPDLLEGSSSPYDPDPPREPEKNQLGLTLIKVTVPTGEACTILRQLQNSGTHGASLFPGPVGLARLVREIARIQKGKL